MQFLKSNKIEDVTVGYFHEFIFENRQTNLSNKQIWILL